MKLHLKPFASIFLLLLFIFPIAEKEIHAFDHAGEIQCTAVSKHLHAEEHHCNVCDFTVNHGNLLAAAEFSFIQQSCNFYFTPFKGSIHFSAQAAHIPARAPPVC